MTLQIHDQDIAQRSKQLGIEIGKQLGEQRGIMIGEQLGERRGIEIGIHRNMRQVARNMMAVGISIDKISDVTGLSASEIEALRVIN